MLVDTDDARLAAADGAIDAFAEMLAARWPRAWEAEAGGAQRLQQIGADDPPPHRHQDRARHDDAADDEGSLHRAR